MDSVLPSRHDLGPQVIHATVYSGQGGVLRGCVDEMSYDGEILVSIARPLRLGTEVVVEISRDGRLMKANGRVRRSARSQMEIGLELGLKQCIFLQHFLDEALDFSRPFTEVIRIVPADGPAKKTEPHRAASKEALISGSDSARS